MSEFRAKRAASLSLLKMEKEILPAECFYNFTDLFRVA
jgi:hypothetical protein